MPQQLELIIPQKRVAFEICLHSHSAYSHESVPSPKWRRPPAVLAPSRTKHRLLPRRVFSLTQLGRCRIRRQLHTGFQHPQLHSPCLQRSPSERHLPKPSYPFLEPHLCNLDFTCRRSTSLRRLQHQRPDNIPNCALDLCYRDRAFHLRVVDLWECKALHAFCRTLCGGICGSDLDANTVELLCHVRGRDGQAQT